MKCKNNSN